MTKTNRVAWGLAAILAAVLLGSILLSTHLVLKQVSRLRAYHGAKHAADSLRGTSGEGYVDLMRVDLSHMDLRGFDLSQVSLAGGDLRGADLRRARMRSTDIHGTLYDHSTRWPLDFDPQLHGAILVK